MCHLSCAVQYAADTVLKLRRVFDFYEAIAAGLLSRPAPADADSSLWACLYRLTDPETGEHLAVKPHPKTSS